MVSRIKKKQSGRSLLRVHLTDLSVILSWNKIKDWFWKNSSLVSGCTVWIFPLDGRTKVIVTWGINLRQVLALIKPLHWFLGLHFPQRHHASSPQIWDSKLTSDSSIQGHLGFKHPKFPQIRHSQDKVVSADARISNDKKFVALQKISKKYLDAYSLPLPRENQWAQVPGKPKCWNC